MGAVRTVSMLMLPYDCGRSGEGLALGPDRLVELGLLDRIEATSAPVEVTRVEVPDEPVYEAARIFELNRRLGRHVGKAMANGSFPLVVSGNCNCCLGATAGAGSNSIGAVWFDAHADFNSPDTSISGFLDGMSISVLTGGAWRAIAATIPGFVPLQERDVLLVGTRDVDVEEAERLAASDISLIADAALVDAGIDELSAAVADMASRVDSVYVHVDLDCLDSTEGRANQFAVPGGPTLDAMRDAIRAVFAHAPVAAASLTAYNPDADSDGRAGRAALALAAEIVTAAS